MKINCHKHGLTKLSNWLERKPKPSDRKDFKEKGKVDYVKCVKCVWEGGIKSEIRQLIIN